MTRVSVCLATFNGAENLMVQLNSIIEQLGANDELIVVDDASSDGTVELLRACGDRRLRLVELPVNGGHIAAFEKAMQMARGEFVVLSDQDDIWPPGRLELIISALAESDLVVGNYRSFGDVSGLPKYPLGVHLDNRSCRNVMGLMLGRRPYFGSCMGFRASLLAAALPFPRHVQAHDHWLAIVAILSGRVVHLADVVTLRRTHSHNLSQDGRPLRAIVKTRTIQGAHILSALARRSANSSES